MTRARIARPARRLELRDQHARQVEDGLDIERHHLVPARFGVVRERRAPVGAGVVHQDVQRGLARGEGIGEGARAGVRREVAGQCDAAAEFESSAAARSQSSFLRDAT